MSDRTRWGILGTGKIAHAFVRDLLTLPDAELVAVGSRSDETARVFGATYGIPRRYGSYEALVGDGGLDVIYVASPHIVHQDHMLLCLEAGIPVLCEKPFTMNADEALRVTQFARERGVFAMEAMWTRFIPLVMQLREMVRGGAIGEPRMFLSSLGQHPDEEVSSYLRRVDEGGGLLLDSVVYPISLAVHFLGQPDAVDGVADFHEGGVDDQETVILSYRRGALATIAASLRAAIPPSFAIYGGEGSVVVEPPLFAPTKAVLRRHGAADKVLEVEREGHGYVYEAMEVMRLLREGSCESQLMPLDESVAIMRVLDDIRRRWAFAYPFEQVVPTS